jgi:hypothetical protein
MFIGPLSRARSSDAGYLIGSEKVAEFSIENNIYFG